METGLNKKKTKDDNGIPLKNNQENGLQKQVDRLKNQLGVLDSEYSKRLSLMESQIKSLVTRVENNG